VANRKLTVNSGAGTDLVFPLGGHNLSVGTRNVDASVEAGLVVSLDNVSAEDLTGADTTVVGALWSREAVPGPAVWPALCIKKGVFLLETKPKPFTLILLHENGSGVTEVELVGLAI